MCGPASRVLVGVILVSGCPLAAQTTVPRAACETDAAPVRQVRAVANGIIAADNARALERVLAYYAADAVLMPPGEQPVVGRAAIRPR